MKPRIHVLFEHGADSQPYGSAQIRLLRPLTHPALCDEFDVTSGLEYAGQAVEAVILDRLWRPIFRRRWPGNSWRPCGTRRETYLHTSTIIFLIYRLPSRVGLRRSTGKSWSFF